MKQLVIMPGGFHPFHAGHAALYQSAVEAFPGADVYVAATNDTSTRPFPFPVKEKLAQLAGVPKGRFTQVKSPFRAEEITASYDPNNTQLIFVRSEKDAGSQPRPGGNKKDGSPGYLQPYDDASDLPMSQRAYMAYLPTVEFGPGMTSATEIRSAWPKLNEKRKTALVMSLYPKTQSNPKLAATVVKLLDTAIGSELDEDITRRGFLQGAGAAAVAGAAASVNAAPFNHSYTVNRDPLADKLFGRKSTVVSNDGRAQLNIQWNSKDGGVWFDMLNARLGYDKIISGYPMQLLRIKFGNGKVESLDGVVNKDSKTMQVGSEEKAKQLAQRILKHRGNLTIEANVAKEGRRVFNFTIEPDATSVNVKEQIANEDISRRGFLKGAGAAALGATGVAQAGQFTSSDDLNKDPESIEKVWKPRMAELQARCVGILNSFKAIASSVKPEWVPILDQVKLEITLGDTSLKISPARATGTTTTTTTPTSMTWAEIKKQNPNEYSIDVWSKVYPNISYCGSAAPGLNPIIDVQIRPDGSIVNTALRTSSKDPAWDQAVLGGISKTKNIPPRPVPADKKSSNQIIRINFPIRFWSVTRPTGPSVTSKSTYRIFVETTVFWDAPDSTLAWVLGHEIGHLVNKHPSGVPNSERRQFELEADEVGAVLAQKIGYDRANFFQWLYNAKAENIKNSDPDPSHPDPINRVNNLKQKTGFELAAVKYIDSMVQQFQNGLAESNGPPGQQGAGMTAGYQRRENQPVSETINSAVLNARFKHKQVIGDYTYTATAEDFEGAPLLWIKAYDGNKEIGHILFEIIVRSPGGRRKPSADYLESGGTEVDPAYRNKGIASTMYAYAKMLGNDIQASYSQTSQGKAMWAAWEKAGDAKHLIGTSMESAVDENQGWAATLENTAPNPRVNLTPNFPNYATLIGEFVGIKKNRALFRIIAAELRPGQGETEKIFRAMSTNTPIGIEIGKVKNRSVVEDAGKEFVLYINGKPAAKYVDQQQAVLDLAAVKKKYPTAKLELKHEVCAMQTVKQINEGGSILEVLKPDAFNALQQAKKNIEQNRQQEIDQWAQDFRANSTKLAGQQLKRAIAPPPVPVAQPGEKHAVLKNRITQLDMAIKKQQQLDALTQKLEYKGLLTPAMQMDFDTRMYVRDAAADNYQALNQKLDRAIELATNRLRTNKLAFKEDADYIEEARKI